MPNEWYEYLPWCWTACIYITLDAEPDWYLNAISVFDMEDRVHMLYHYNTASTLIAPLEAWIQN